MEEATKFQCPNCGADHKVVRVEAAPAYDNIELTCLGCGAQINSCARVIAQFQMSSNEIGMKMGQEHMLDRKRVLCGEGQVLVNIPLRIYDGGRACLFVPNDVGGVSQARQIELLEDHRRNSLVAKNYFGCGTMRR